MKGVRTKVATATEKAEAGVKSAVDSVKSTIDNVKTGAAAIKDSFEAGVESAKGAIASGAAAAKEAVGAGVETLKQAVGTGAEVAKGAVQAVSAFTEKAWLSQIQQLDSAGGTLTATLGGGGSFKGVKLSGEGELQMRRNADNSYSLFVGGKLGAGLSAKLTETPGATLKAEAMLNMGGKIEYKFDSPEDAAKAARILSSKAVASAVGTAPVAGPLLSTGHQLASRVSGDDAFLADKVASITFSREAAGALKAELGLQLKGVNVDAKMAQTSSIRLELNPGKPALVVVNELSGEFNGNVKALEAFSLSGGVKGKITAEQRYELSGMEDFSKDPLGALKKTFAANRPEGRESLRLSLEGRVSDRAGEGRALGLSKADTASITLGMTGKPGEIYNPHVLASLLQLDLAKTANLLGDTSVSLTVSTASSSGVDFKQGLGALGTGIDLKVAVQRRDNTDLFSGKTSFRDVPSAIANAWSKS